MAAVAASEASTGSKTMADMVILAAEKHGDAPALRHKQGDEWVDTSYAELGRIVREVALGLIDLGIQPGDRVSILSHTRPEWTFADFGILATGAAQVSIYQTNSPEECQYVLEHSESRAVFCEDAEQLAKIEQIRGSLPNLEHVIAFEDAGDGVIGLDELRERGRGRDESEFQERLAAVSPDDVCVFIYTSGTTGPPKGCILTHSNYRSIANMIEAEGVFNSDDVSYLFLPLAHAFALLIQFVSIDLGGTIAYWEKDAQKIIPNLMEVRPTYFPSVPRMFEKIYTLATSAAEDPQQLEQAVQLGVKGRQMKQRGEEVPA